MFLFHENVFLPSIGKDKIVEINKLCMYLGNLVGEGGVFAMIVNILTVSIILVRMLIHYREVETLVDFFF